MRNIESFGEFLNEAGPSMDTVENNGIVDSVDDDGAILYKYKNKWYKITQPETGECEMTAFDKNPTGEDDYELIHYTGADNLESIRKNGLRPYSQGTFGPGVYFWPLKAGVRPTDLAKDTIAVRVNPEYSDNVPVNFGAGKQSDDREAFTKNKVPVKYLQLFNRKTKNWENLI